MQNARYRMLFANLCVIAPEFTRRSFSEGGRWLPDTAKRKWTSYELGLWVLGASALSTRNSGYTALKLVSD